MTTHPAPATLDLDGLEEVVGHRVEEDGLLRLSFSRIDTYRTCPLQYRFVYEDRLPSVPSPALSFGSAIHTALERFYRRELPEPPSLEELLGYLYEAWDSTGFAEVDRDEQLRYYRFAQEVLRRFHRREAPRYRLPADVERYFELPVEPDITVVGYIDRVDADPETGALEVIDYKTARRVRDRAAVRRSLQLAIYALACRELYGQLPTAVTLDFVVPGVKVRVPIEEIDLDAALATIRDTADAIRARRFDPSPNPLCDWCDFRRLCPAWEGDGPDVRARIEHRLAELRRRMARDLAEYRTLERQLQGV